MGDVDLDPSLSVDERIEALKGKLRRAIGRPNFTAAVKALNTFLQWRRKCTGSGQGISSIDD